MLQPKKVLVDLTKVFQAAQSYVMLSRCQSLDQLFILQEVPKKKLYADTKAIEEVQRLEAISINKNLSPWNKQDSAITKIAFLNIQSIQNKMDWIASDHSLQQATSIFISETWLDENDSSISLPGYHDVHIDRVNITKLVSPNLEAIGVYRSSNGNVETLIETLKTMIVPNRNTVIGGDFNLDLLKNGSNLLTRYLTSQGFKQVVSKATHTGGGCIDHCYVKIVNEKSYDVEVVPKVFTDHDCVCFSMDLN